MDDPGEPPYSEPFSHTNTEANNVNHYDNVRGAEAMYAIPPPPVPVGGAGDDDVAPPLPAKERDLGEQAPPLPSKMSMRQ